MHTVPRMLPSNGQILAAVDVDYLARDHARVLAAEVNDGLADLFDVGRSTHGVRVRLLLHDRVNLNLIEAGCAVQISVQIRGRHAVHADTEARKLNGRRLGDTFERGLGHAVADEAGLGLAALDARNVHDAALTRNEHILEEVDEHVGCAHIQILQEVEVLRERRLQITRKNHSSAVNKYV